MTYDLDHCLQFLQEKSKTVPIMRFVQEENIIRGTFQQCANRVKKSFWIFFGCFHRDSYPSILQNGVITNKLSKGQGYH